MIVTKLQVAAKCMSASQKTSKKDGRLLLLPFSNTLLLSSVWNPIKTPSHAFVTSSFRLPSLFTEDVLVTEMSLKVLLCLHNIPWLTSKALPAAKKTSSAMRLRT